MIDLIHRLRRIAQMAGDARRQRLEDMLRADGRGGRALLEQRHPREVAAALMRLCAALGFEGLGHAHRLVAWCHMLGGAAGLAEASSTRSGSAPRSTTSASSASRPRCSAPTMR